MRLRPRRRNLVVWSSHPGAAAGYGMPRFTQPMRPRRLRPCIRACALLTVIGLLGLARGVRARWRPVLAGVVFTAVGLVLRSGPGGVLLLPGLMFLLTAPLLPANSKADRARCSELAGRLLNGEPAARSWRDLRPVPRRDHPRATRHPRPANRGHG